MRHKLLLLLLLLLPAWAARAQVTLAQETFETDGEGTRYTTTVPAGNVTTLGSTTVQRYFVRTNTNPVVNPSNTILFGLTAYPTTLGNVQGSYFYAGERAGTAATPASVRLNSFSTSGYSGLKLTVALADARGPSWSGTTNSGGAATVQQADKIILEYSTDGGNTYAVAGQFVGNNTNGSFGYLQVDTNKDGAITSADGAQSTANTLDITFRDFSFDIPSASATTVVRVSYSTELDRVEAAFDNIRVTGTVSSVAPPTLANIESTPVSYAEGAAATQITNALTVSSSTSVTKATVTIASGRGPGDVLDLPTTTGISDSYDSSTGILTLTGTASAAAYQAALQTVTFYNPDANNVQAGTRKISFIAYTGTGGTSGSGEQTRNVVVTASLSAATGLPYLENFESNTGEGTDYASNTFTATNGAAWLRTNNPTYQTTATSNSPTTFSNYGDTYYWYGDQTNSVYASGGKSTIVTRQINTGSNVNLKFQISLGAKATNGNDWHVTDYFQVNYRVAGASSYTPLVLFRGTAPAGGTGGTLRREKDPTTSLTSTTAPTGRLLVAALDTVQAQFPASVNGQTIELQVVSASISIVNEVAFDNIRVYGTPQTTVNSITRANANPTNAATVNYTVTFGATVTGLTASNFTLTAPGFSTAPTIGTPVQGTGNTWTVPVNTGAGSGNLTLNLANDTGLSYDITTTLPFAGETYNIDKAAPTVSSVTGPNNGTYGAGAALNFTVNFSEAVTVTGTPQLTLTIGSTTRQATYQSGSGSTALTFRYTTVSGDNDTDGLTSTSPLALNGGTIRDAATNNATLTFTPPNTTGVLVDTQGPTVSSVTVPANGSYRAGQVLSFVVNFSEAATVTGTPQLALVIGSTTRQASYASGSGTSALTFSYTIVAGENDTDGIALGALTLNGGTIRDAAANDATLTLNGVPSTAGILVDTAAPGVSITSTAGNSNTTTNTTPIPFTVTFSETVTGFGQTKLNVSGGAITNFTGTSPGTTYTFNVTPSGTNTLVTVNIAANAATDAAGNGNTAATPYSLTYQPAVVATSKTVTVNLAANGTGTLQASDVNNGSTGAGTPTYTIQKIVYGRVAEGSTLTLTTPNGANFTGIRFASYGTPTNDTNGNYRKGSCDAANSLTTAQNSFSTTRSTGNMDAVNGNSGNNSPTLGDPCSGTPKALAVQAAYSADATSLNYDCNDVSSSTKTNYVLLTVTDANGNTNTAVATVIVNTSPTISITSISPGSAQRGTSVTVNGSNLGGVTTVTVGGATATVSSNNGSSFAFVVPSTAATGAGNLTVTAPCSQSLTPAFTVQQTQTATPALTTPANGSTTNGNPTFAGTSAPNALIRFYLNGQDVGTTTANGSGNFGVLVGSTLPSGAYTLYVTALVTGQSVSNNSSTINFTVDSTQPTPTVSTTSASPTSTAPIPFRVTFNEAVTGFTSASVSVTNGTVNTFSGSGTTYNLTITPSGTGTVTVRVAENVTQDGVGNQNVASNSVSVQYNQPVTATPVLTRPVNGSFVSNNQPEYRGTSAPNAFIFIYRATGSGSFALTDTTIANGLGNFHKFSTNVLADGQYSVYVTATTSGSATSANSNTSTFTVDTTSPTVTLSSGTVAANGTTSTSPVNFTATFSEAVVIFNGGSIQVTNGSVVSGPTAGANNTYTFQVRPTAAGGVSVTVAAGAARDLANNANSASATYAFTFAAPTITVAPASLPNGQQGVAYTANLSASGGSGTYTYAVTSSALPNGLSLTNGTISGTPTANGSFSFRITATDNSAAPGPYSGFRNYTLVIDAPAVTSVVWNGSQSQDWFTAANWTPNQVPDATIDAIIPSAPSGNRFPLIGANAAQATAKNVSIASLASLTMNANTLTIAANLTNNGTFNGYSGSGGSATGGTVVLGGSAQSSITGGGTNRFWNLTVGANGAQLTGSSAASVLRLLTLNGNFASNDALTLGSDATATAMVVNSGGVVTGNVTVQRYIDPTLNPNLGYRHVSPAISNATVSSLTTGSYSPVVNPAYNGSTTPLTTRPFPTVYGYDQSRLATTTNNLGAFDKGWFSPNATSDPLPVGLGRTVLIAANQTWNFTGTLNNGDQTLNLGRNSGATAANSGLHLVGNPYPSPLDWGQVGSGDRTNVDNVIYVWRSTNPSNPYSGAYGSYNNGTFTGALTSTVLAQGQGFFVRVTQGQTAGSLTFRNAQRVSTYQSPTYGRTAETRPFVRLALRGVGSSDVDDAVVYFEQGASAGHDGEYDAEKLSNPSGLNVSTSVSADLRMAINGLNPLGTSQLVVPVAVGVPAVGSYTLKAAELLNLGGTPTYLRDRQTGAVIDLAQQPSYQFSVSDASALITSRFELVFSPQQPLATATAALAQQVALYPNPATSSAFVELPAQLGRQVVTATLVDAVGREVRSVKLPAQGAVAHTLDLRELPSGVYMLRLNTSAGTLVKKLTVE